MSCSYCGASEVIARGLCRACYHRLRRNGSVQRKYVINSGECSAPGCEKASFAKNLCQAHYNRAQHPIKGVWKLLRSRYPGQYPAAWEDFDGFLEDIGARPSPKHQLRRIDHSKPYSKANIRWVEPVSRPDYMSQADRSAYGREWTLQRRFKITGDQFKEMLAAQGGVCAICGNKETHKYKSGKLKELAVDHCHDSKKVRGLLCMNCNQALGRFQDNIENLRRAIRYLEAKSDAAQLNP